VEQSTGMDNRRT